MAIHGMAPLLGEEIGELDGALVRDHGFDGRSDVVLFDLPPGHLVPARSGGARPGGTRSRQHPAGSVWAPAAAGPGRGSVRRVRRTLRTDGDDPRWIAKRLWGQTRIRHAVAAWSRLTGEPAGGLDVPGHRARAAGAFVPADAAAAGAGPHDRGQPPPVAPEGPGAPGNLGQRVPARPVRGRAAGVGSAVASARRPGSRAARRVAAHSRRRDGPPGRIAVRPAARPVLRFGHAADRGHRRGLERAGQRHRPGGRRGGQAQRAAVPGRHRGRAAHRPARSQRRRVCLEPPVRPAVEIEGDATTWLRAALGEMARVTRPGGRVVVLAPACPARQRSRPNCARPSRTGSGCWARGPGCGATTGDQCGVRRLQAQVVVGTGARLGGRGAWRRRARC